MEEGALLFNNWTEDQRKLSNGWHLLPHKGVGCYYALIIAWLPLTTSLQIFELKMKVTSFTEY